MSTEDQQILKGKNAVASIIMENAPAKITHFNDMGLHYNIVANEIDRVRQQKVNPFDRSFIPYIIAGLISFDMQRMMGKQKYSFEEGFASRLDFKLHEIRPLLEPLTKFSLASIDLQRYRAMIEQAYITLSTTGINALHEDKTKFFHVGTTKILHFLNPDLFIIIDSNAARAYRTAWQIPFRNSTQPGFSSDLYIECMECAQIDIRTYGLAEFQILEPKTPTTRIYDKLTFVTGSERQLAH